MSGTRDTCGTSYVNPLIVLGEPTTSATAAAPNFFPNYRTASGQAEDAPTAASPDYTSTSPRQYMARIANERAGYLSERAAYQNRR